VRTPQPFYLSCLFALGAAMALGIFSGCGSAPDGPERYTVSGTVTHYGEPVPKGFIEFIPDTEKGNSGPGGGAEIEGGEYATPRQKGIVGGHYIVRIRGTDGVPTTEEGEELPEGKELFPLYETRVEFPSEDTTRDFEVPAEPAKK